MPSLYDRVRGMFSVPTAKAAKTQAPYATSVARMRLVSGYEHGRRSARLLRNFADRSEALRTAINWRKQQVSQANWHIVRTDDPKKAPNPKVEAAIRSLFNIVNSKRESMRSLLDMIVEDILILDAGCIEKEFTFGGQVKYLWAVDGATIAPDPNWDGREQNAIRYRQWIEGRLITELRNDQMIYMMQNPSTHRVFGWSPVETLVNVIEAELYGEKYDYELLRKAAPPGILDLGGGLQDEQVTAFREYWKSEIEGTGDTPIMGGGDPGRKGLVWEKFGWSPAEMQRDAYKSWLINKIAFVFQIDKTIFGLVDDVNRSSAKTMSERTDQGFVTLARLVSEYFTREIVWHFDENHGFEFTDLTLRDPLTQAKIDQIYSQIGVVTPNELRAERFGTDPVEWGDAPYNSQSSATPDPLSDNEEGQKTAQDLEGAAKSIVPFVGRHQMRIEKRRSGGNSEN